MAPKLLQPNAFESFAQEALRPLILRLTKESLTEGVRCTGSKNNFGVKALVESGSGPAVSSGVGAGFRRFSVDFCVFPVGLGGFRGLKQNFTCCLGDFSGCF